MTEAGAPGPGGGEKVTGPGQDPGPPPGLRHSPAGGTGGGDQDDKAFKDLAAARVKEYQDLVGQMLRGLDASRGRRLYARRRQDLTSPTAKALEMARKLSSTGPAIPRTRQPPPGTAEARAYIPLIRLAGPPRRPGP